jgi:hypothetical protein
VLSKHSFTCRLTFLGRQCTMAHQS